MFSALKLFAHLGEILEVELNQTPAGPAGYVTEDGTIFYAAEDGTTTYVTES